MSTNKSRKPTQSHRLYQLFTKNPNGVTVRQMARKLQLKPAYMGSYLAEMKRVYGAKIKYNRDEQVYRLRNRIEVPRHGCAGRPAASA